MEILLAKTMGSQLVFLKDLLDAVMELQMASLKKVEPKGGKLVKGESLESQ